MYLSSPLTSQPMPPLPYTQPPPGARVAGGCKERCVWAVTPLPAQVTAPRSRAWQDCLITHPPLLTPTPFVSRVFARICQRVAHVHLTQIPFGARQARLAPSCIQARAWLPSTGDRSSRIASTPSPRRVDQLGWPLRLARFDSTTDRRAGGAGGIGSPLRRAG